MRVSQQAVDANNAYSKVCELYHKAQLCETAMNKTTGWAREMWRGYASVLVNRAEIMAESVLQNR